MIKFNFKKDINSIFNKNKMLYITSSNFKKRMNYILNILKKKDFNKILIVTEKNKLKDTVSEIKKLKINKQIIVVNFESLNKIINIDLKAFYILKTNNDLKQYATELVDSKLKPVIINGNFTKPDIIVVDSAHKLGSYPQVNKAAQILRRLSKGIPILASGFNVSPTGKLPQLYNQLYAFNRVKDSNFYNFAKKYINIKYVNLRYSIIKNYDNLNANGKRWYDNIVKDLVINIDDQTYNDNDTIHTLPIGSKVESMINELQKNNVLTFKNKIYNAFEIETKQKYIHQLLSGTIKLNDQRYILDDFKAKFIKEQYKNKKLLIICRFIAEQDMLNNIFKNNPNITIIGYINNLPKEKYDYIIFHSMTTNVIKYQNVVSTYDDIQKVYIFVRNSIESDMYIKLKMQINSLE